MDDGRRVGEGVQEGFSGVRPGRAATASRSSEGAFEPHRKPVCAIVGYAKEVFIIVGPLPAEDDPADWRQGIANLGAP